MNFRTFFKTVLKKIYFFLSIAFDHCHYSPCLNNGTCYNLPINFTCDCMPGFSGPSCESEYQRRNSWREKKLWSFFPCSLPPPSSSSFPLSFFPSVYFSYFLFSSFSSFLPIPLLLLLLPIINFPHYSFAFFPPFLLRLLLFLPVPSLSFPFFSSSSSLFSFSVMSASFSSFFHYLLHYPPSHLSSSPLISTFSFCFSHFPIFFVFTNFIWIFSFLRFRSKLLLW